MAKLHETLAVEKSLETTAKKLTNESINTLSKENLFMGSIKETVMFDADRQHENLTNHQDLTTTVDENIDYVVPHLVNWYDAVLTKDLTNQTAKADIVIGTKIIAKDVPATYLLGMETKLNDLRKLYEAIKTLPPNTKWIDDKSNAKDGVFITVNTIETFKTEKAMDYQVIVEPTEFHPAQVKELSKVMNIAKTSQTITCGMLSPVEKARRINNLDTLLVAVRKARQRANNVDLVKGNVGQALMDYINKE